MPTTSKESSFNPDVLSCLANLSSDEVFTPPKIVNDMLDMLPQKLFRDPNATFLDPACKTGVFLREIAKRLIEGLEQTIPDLNQRLEHIYRHQIFGIGMTEITALMSRRSLYCSKYADGEYSVVKFQEPDGNIRYKRTMHTWSGGSCIYCGASQEKYQRNSSLESHAYEFIHKDNPEGIFKMKFDVIIGNPPYQLDDGGFGASASPIYHLFIQQAKKLNPRYLSMIIPARWFSGGKGLNDFRSEMLNDDRIRKLVDFENASDVFPGVDIAGGICYFLWTRDTHGLCDVTNIRNGKEYTSTRSLNEFPTFIRHGQAVSIVKKVLGKQENCLNEQVSPRKPFGLATNVRPLKQGDIILRWQNGEGPYNSKEITTGVELIDKWKVITSYVGYDHAGNPGKDGKRRVFSKIDILPPGTICTETYLIVGAYDNKEEAQNLVRYMKTLFFRFLVSQFMFSHHLTREAYSLVPKLDMKKQWRDSDLFARYGLNEDEIAFIETMIKPMDQEDSENVKE